MQHQTTNKEELSDGLIEFKCPHCGALLTYPEISFGSAQECPHCSDEIVVPPPGSPMGGKLPLPIQTARLIIRPLQMEDLSDWLDFIKDEDSYKFLDHYEPNEDEAISWLRNAQFLRLSHPKGYLPLGIERRDDGKLIGHLSIWLTDPEDHRQGTFHLLMHPMMRHQGYGVEAVLGIFDFGFNGIDLHDIRASIDSRNLVARRMVEKAGMRLEGEFIEQRRVRGQWISMAYYALLSTWWRNGKI